MPPLTSNQRWSFIDAEGTETSLHPIDRVRGANFMTPDIQSSQVVDDAGGIVTGVRYPIQTIQILFALVGSTGDEFEAKLSALARSLDHEREPDAYGGDVIRPQGRLRVTNGSEARSLHCLYAGSTDDRVLPHAMRPAMRFAATTPYWLSENPTAIGPWGIDPSGVQTWIPLLPLNLTSSTIAVSSTIQNPGDVRTWPVWTIRGPATNPVLRDLGREVSLALTIALAAGEWVTIDTRREYRTIVDNNGNNRLGTMDLTTEMWPLASGETVFAAELNDGDELNTEVSGEFTARWKTPPA